MIREAMSIATLKSSIEALPEVANVRFSRVPGGFPGCAKNMQVMYCDGSRAYSTVKLPVADHGAIVSSVKEAFHNG